MSESVLNNIESNLNRKRKNEKRKEKKKKKWTKTQRIAFINCLFRREPIWINVMEGVSEVQPSWFATEFSNHCFESTRHVTSYFGACMCLFLHLSLSLLLFLSLSLLFLYCRVRCLHNFAISLRNTFLLPFFDCIEVSRRHISATTAAATTDMISVCFGRAIRNSRIEYETLFDHEVT